MFHLALDLLSPANPSSAASFYLPNPEATLAPAIARLDCIVEKLGLKKDLQTAGPEVVRQRAWLASHEALVLAARTRLVCEVSLHSARTRLVCEVSLLHSADMHVAIPVPGRVLEGNVGLANFASVLLQKFGARSGYFLAPGAPGSVAPTCLRLHRQVQVRDQGEDCVCDPRFARIILFLNYDPQVEL
jgi:hypothetical protein